MKEEGIVLRRFLPKKQKCSVFTRGRGKIDLAFSSEREVQKLWPGMILSFTTTESTSRVAFCRELEIITAPLPLQHSALKLVHSLLEICYYFMPLEDPSENVFTYLERMLFIVGGDGVTVLTSTLAHRLCYMGLLMECGFSPPQALISIITLFTQELFAFVDFPQRASVQSLEKMLALSRTLPELIFDEWIQSCVQQHPYEGAFKIVL